MSYSVSMYLPAIISTLFRLGVYIFLRVVPVSHLKTILPSLYVLYLSSLYFHYSSEEPKVLNAKVKASSQSPDRTVETPGSSETRAPIGRTGALTTIIFALPSTQRALRITNLVINTLLILATADFVVEPLLDDASNVIFTRVGAIYPDSAKIVVRYPRENATESQLRIVWRQHSSDGDTPWQDGPLVSLKQQDDWVHTVLLQGLWPSTVYEYGLEGNDRAAMPYPANPIQFKTFPDPQLSTGSHFRFVVSSCATTNFPYVPFHGRRIKGFDLLADYLWPANPGSSSIPTAETQEMPSTSSSPNISRVTETSPSDMDSVSQHLSAEFMLFLGDFVYADVPIYYGDDKETYRRLYRRNYQSASFRRVYERLPIFHTYDDHEIINNFVGQGNDSTPPFPNADDAFRLYNAEANYDSPDNKSDHYYDFRYGDVAFFVLDTRRYRSDIRTEEVATRTMLGDKQLAALYSWLGQVNNTATFKFIVTSVPFTSLWQHDALLDSWAAYTYEKTALLSALHSVPNVILLSGDPHEFAAIEFNSEGQGHKVLEISTSPISMFYVPFIRTLRMASEGIVHHIRANSSTSQGEGNIPIIEEIPQENVLKYIPTGNYKWSSFEVDTRNFDHPMVHLEVVIDNTSAYRLTIAGQPVELHTSTALGMFIPQSLRGILEKFGLNVNYWS